MAVASVMGDDTQMKAQALLLDFYNELIQKSESYKFIRMADDLHDVAQYLNDMRLCFVALTITGYVLLVGYGLLLCVRRNRRPARGRRNWDYQIESRGDFTAPATTAPAQTEDLVAVRSDGQTATGYMGRNHHSRDPSRNPPSFMRHGHMNHQQTTRLMADQDVVKHTIPHITTDPPPADATAKVPQLVKDQLETA